MSEKYIPLSVPNLKGKELEYVTRAIETEWVSTAGPYISEFEDNVAKYTGARGAVSCQNGTSGLHIALRVLEVTSEDEIIVPTLTFIAAVNPVKYIGAEPIFMDCDDTLNIDADKVRAFCETECDYINSKLINKTSKKHIKAIIVVHVFGNMADMEKIMSIADEYNLKVVEDATEALGTYYTAGKYKDKHAGTIGDIGVYSFNGNKIMTTGGGGMIVSNNEELLKKAKHLTTQAKSNDLYYIHDDIGYNYRMTNLQAALGLAQLEQLEGFIETKKTNYERYKSEIESIHGLRILDFNEHTRPNYWFYALSIDKEYKLKRDQLISYLSSKCIQSRPIWGLISEQTPYRANQIYKIEKAQIYLENMINIPCSSNLSKEDVQYVVECLQHRK
ncbi:aminotransferase DegT [Halolactibacillus alkaliphilus]|uniref:Aminotransferase DegT n=1 Tax=Halolactibacillus alkaliphilus TaxID=442899 RepID=A0A511X2D1_9BACI|nr:LegC family aminotransferase [Halolactibacillus alkaliphilus]GEN57107.1 aminotransferase DegT [Halolactibacillus alkaliphilus]GGN71985.1 aminotransferase DegT [Halolactibacillus alkaliphilus]SFO86713.1 aminotransferase, LLPSF_NHT_00031 family [Halolactibacillus alkaliphilus]